jgi:hypothetical protein
VIHRRVRGDRWLLACVAALAMMSGAARAVADDTRELKAREEFAAGRYQQALDLFAKLYAETLHPVYLRNIGRCYQNLGDPDRAIISFRDYLRKHKTISVEERKDVEAFIAEMEELKKQRGASATPPPETSTAPPQAASTITPLPSAPEPASSGAAPEALVTVPGGSAHEASSPVYTRWWFWTIVGAAAVGAGLGIAAATGAFTKTQDAGCMAGYTCE